MNVNYTAEELAFRDEVRAFLKSELPADIAAKVKLGKHMSKEDHQRWQQILVKRGWYAPGWPVELGGTTWGPVEKHIFDEECSAFGAPRTVPFGVNMVAPVIIKFGTQQQIDHYLPRILSGEDWWCQGYSEPGAGSDLASLKTRAVRDGDHYVVNGQKTWTTLGQHANMIFCLVRTDPEAQQQRGISFLLIDMKSPGISVRPIITLDGDHEVNEVFFDNVRVPVENLVGEENQGWTCAKYLLTHERTGLAGIGSSKAVLAHLKRIAMKEVCDGKPMLEDPLFRAQVAEVEMQLMAVEMSTLRILAAAKEGGVPGAESSILKIKGTEIRQAITHLLRKVIGPYALPFLEEELQLDYEGELLHADYSASLAGDYFNMRKLSIFGGSMDFKLTEEQQMLQDTAARLVRDAYPFEQREKFSESELGFSAEFWSQLGELGLTAVPFSEEIGGFGGSGVETMLVMTELGRGLTLEPYLQSVILAGGLINQLGSDAQKQDLLPQVAAGSLQLAVAFDEPQSHYNLNDVQTRAEAVDGGYRLSGRKAVVIGGHSAGQIIVSARTSGDSRDETGISLFLIDPNAQGVSRRVYPTIDGRKGCDLFLDNVQVGAEALLGELGNALPSMRYQQGRAIAAQCADALGSMDEACKLTLDYLKTRKQFGVPIGKFQVLHGGIGMTWEYNLAHHAKRLVMIAHQFGDDDHHLKAYAKLMQVA